jgi:hypothetical protein
MAQSILIFDFGANEEAARQARHKIDAWKQSFHLGNKILLKFERKGSAGEAQGDGQETGRKKPARGAGKPRAKSVEAKSEDKDEQTPAEARLLIRLDFSGHEKLSHQRWLERIPAEEPFKSAKSEIIHQSDPAFGETSDLFDSLD